MGIGFILFASKEFWIDHKWKYFFANGKSLPFSIIRKESFEIETLEALLFGTSGLLNAEKEDLYFNDLKIRYFYLLHKEQLDKVYTDLLQFFKHRPGNFPTIRLSRLESLYSKHQNLFSKVIILNCAKEVYELLTVTTSLYWENHYQFDKESPQKRKPLSRPFTDLWIVNTIIPLKFASVNRVGESNVEDLIAFMNEVFPEKKALIDKFESFGIRSKNAFKTQTLLELKNEYCNNKACLRCALGIELMKSN